MYRLYIEYALNILRHKPGYTLKRAVAFFGNHYRQFKEIYDIIAGIYDDQKKAKQSRDIYNLTQVINTLRQKMEFLDSRLERAIKNEKWIPTASRGGIAHSIVEVGEEYGDVLLELYAHKGKGLVKPDAMRGISLKEPTRTIVNKRTGKERRLWERVRFQNLEIWNKSKPWDAVYKRTPEAMQTIADYLNTAQKQEAKKASTSEYWTGYVFLELLNL